MLLSLSSSAVRAAILAAAVLLAVVLSYYSIRGALAAHYAESQTLAGLQRAAQLEPGNPRWWYLLGHYLQFNPEQPDLPRATDAYRRCLSLDPNSAAAFLDLGAAFEAENNQAAARDAFLSAKRVYPLSAVVAWRYGNFLLRQGELDPAFREIRQAIELDPKRAAEAFSRGLRVDPNPRELLDRMLPASSAVYLDVIRDRSASDDLDPALAVWDRLLSLRQSIALRSSIPLIESLFRVNRIAEARRRWDEAVRISEVAPPADLPGSLIWDGGFETGFTNGGFGWQIIPLIDGVKVDSDTQEKHSGAASLRLTFDGHSNLAYENVCSAAPVQSGQSYLFSAWVKTRSLTTDEGVRFRLRAADLPGSPVMDTPDTNGTRPWTRIELPWTAPAGARQVRVCVSRRQSGASDGHIQGAAWLDDVALQPVSGAPRP